MKMKHRQTDRHRGISCHEVQNRSPLSEGNTSQEIMGWVRTVLEKKPKLADPMCGPSSSFPAIVAPAKTVLIKYGLSQETGCIYPPSLSLFIRLTVSDSPFISSLLLISSHKICVYYNNLSSPLPLRPALLPPTERALLSRASGPVLRSRDRQCAWVPALTQHRLQRPEAWEHSAGFTGTHHPDRFRFVQGEYRAQRDHVDFLRYTRGKEEKKKKDRSQFFGVIWDILQNLTLFMHFHCST